MTPESEKLLEAQLILQEGRRHHPYLDTKNNWTVGIGRNLANGLSENEQVSIIGYAKVLPYITLVNYIKARPLSDAQIDLLFQNDLHSHQKQLLVHFPWMDSLADARVAVFVNMIFNMGLGNDHHGLISFRNTLELVQESKFSEAAQQLRDSHWAKQVGDRATVLAAQLEAGEFLKSVV
jgi:lysozyme